MYIFIYTHTHADTQRMCSSISVGLRWYMIVSCGWSCCVQDSKMEDWFTHINCFFPLLSGMKYKTQLCCTGLYVSATAPV